MGTGQLAEIVEKLRNRRIGWFCPDGIYLYLDGGTSAPQNLQRTVSILLLAGTTWSLLHMGHVRLRRNIERKTANNGFIDLAPFLFVSRIFLSSKVLKIRLD